MNALNISQTSFVEDDFKRNEKGNDDYELTVHYTEGEPIAEKYQALRQKSILKRFLNISIHCLYKILKFVCYIMSR